MDDCEPDIHVVFERGEVVFLAAWEEAFSHYTVELLSPSGRLRCEQNGDVIQWLPTECVGGHQALATQPLTIETDMSRYQWHVTDQLARSIYGSQQSLCSGEAALNTLTAIKNIVSVTN